MRLSTLSAAGTALTNSVAETRLGVYSILAGGMQVEKEYQLFAQVRATATNATDTLQVRFRCGPTTLTGTAVWASTAVDVANDDIITIHARGVVRALSATAGAIYWSGYATIPGASGTSTAREFFSSITNLNNITATQLLEITGIWSVANAGNSCQLEAFAIDEFVIGKG